MKRLLTIFSILLITGSAAAVCPDTVGLFTYASGTLQGGRATEAWCAGGPGQPGNTQNAMSWDGVTLGGQWKVWDTVVDASGAQLMFDTVDVNGNGTRSYHTNYTGGSFWFSKDGAWGDGVHDLTGTIGLCVVDIMVTYLGGQAVAATSNIHMNGAFDDCYGGCVIDYIISNATLVWSSASGLPLPVNYPALLCGANGGEAFDLCCSQMQISCVVADEANVWGAVKSIYR